MKPRLLSMLLVGYQLLNLKLDPIPASKKQMWLARGGIAAVVILLVTLKLVGVEVSVLKQGATTVYRSPMLLSIVSGALGVVVGVVAVVFWMQTGLFFRGVAAVLGLIAVFTLFNAPTGLNHHLIVTPDYFRLRVGSWYSPVDTEVKFSSVDYLAVDKAKGGGYELRVLEKDGNQIAVPIYDLMKKALPEVFREAALRGVVIGEGADGLQIPSALTQ